MLLLEGKSVIITGGASGIGAATAALAAKAGARVTVADLDRERGDAVVAQIVEEGGEAQFVRADISAEADVAAMVEAAVGRYDALHCAFNNAGAPGYSHTGHGSRLTHFADLPLDAFRRNIEINVVGTFLCMKHEIAAMLATGGGSIVNTSSGAGVLAIEGAADYVSSKHAVIGLTKAAALDYATRGIRANAVIPGVIRTPMVETSFAGNPDMDEWAIAAQPNKRMGRPSEVGEAVIWMLSDAASLVTGISMPVDGGYTMV